MNLAVLFKRKEKQIVQWMANHSILLLRISIGIIFFWFGVLKFFPQTSSAEDLAARTLDKITFQQIPNNISIIILAAWECFIGIGMIIGRARRITLVLLFLQMIGTILPVFFFPNETFVYIPFVPSMEGQYILKNLIIIAAAIVLGATIRGGAIIANSPIALKAKKEEKEKLEKLKISN